MVDMFFNCAAIYTLFYLVQILGPVASNEVMAIKKNSAITSVIVTPNEIQRAFVLIVSPLARSISNFSNHKSL